MLTRRQFAQAAAALGATLALGCTGSHKPRWTERRELYPQGVASGDPDPDSVILWTRRAPAKGETADSYLLTLEVARDPGFKDVVSTATTTASRTNDFTVRFLAAGLAPACEYWYRFTDEQGNGSRVGRTITAPTDDDEQPVRFTFVSCQDVTQGANNAWRRMIFEDEKRERGERLGFVMHLGDFVYEVVEYPEDAKQGRRYNRKLRDLIRFPHGEKHLDFHVPTTLDDYRLLYHTYLTDLDLQDARARWPFVCVWDNHEFSWLGFQSIQVFEGKRLFVPTRKVCANRAWWEYQPARVKQPKVTSFDDFDVPKVTDTPIEKFDEHGFGDEPNNRAAVASLAINRSFRYGKNADVILTDNRSHKNADSGGDDFTAPDFPMMLDEDAARVIDDGRTANGGNPPATLKFGGKDFPNPGRDEPMQSYLGPEQRVWLIGKLTKSLAPWKIWGHSFGTLAWRADPQNLPVDRKLPKWPGKGYGLINGGYYAEHAEIFDAVKNAGVTGLAIVAGDKHSFWAGLATKDLPPRAFDPVGVEFITGSISALGFLEAAPTSIKPDHPLRTLFLGGKDGEIPAVNFLILHGVRSALALSQDPDPAKARALRNPDVAPHLSFADYGGHGYSMVTVSKDALETEFVCIPNPLERAGTPEGGPLRYRVTHRVPLWSKGERPKLEQKVIEGDAQYSI